MAGETRYHINPEMGRPNICRATGKRGCKYKAENGAEPPHYVSEQEAREDYEKQRHGEAVPSPTSKRAGSRGSGVVGESDLGGGGVAAVELGGEKSGGVESISTGAGATSSRRVFPVDGVVVRAGEDREAAIARLITEKPLGEDEVMVGTPEQRERFQRLADEDCREYREEARRQAELVLDLEEERRRLGEEIEAEGARGYTEKRMNYDAMEIKILDERNKVNLALFNIRGTQRLRIHDSMMEERRRHMAGDAEGE